MGARVSSHAVLKCILIGAGSLGISPQSALSPAQKSTIIALSNSRHRAREECLMLSRLSSKSPRGDFSSTQAPLAHQRPRWKRTLLMGVLAAAVLAAIWVFGIPWIQLTLNTVSTDDAYVNGHVTFVAARVSGQIARVLVDDNNRVHKGDLLAQLDKEPFQDAVAVKRTDIGFRTA